MYYTVSIQPPILLYLPSLSDCPPALIILHICDFIHLYKILEQQLRKKHDIYLSEIGIIQNGFIWLPSMKRTFGHKSSLLVHAYLLLSIFPFPHQCQTGSIPSAVFKKTVCSAWWVGLASTGCSWHPADFCRYHRTLENSTNHLNTGRLRCRVLDLML